MKKLKTSIAIENTKQQIAINDLIDFFNDFLEIISSSIGDVLNYAQSNRIKDIKQYEGFILKAINKKSSKKEIKGFLNIAKNDLKDYKNLINEKSYSSAIYHLQQSVEKTIKALCFFIFIDFKPKSIGHDFSKIMPLFKKDGVLSDILKDFFIRLDDKLNNLNSKSKIFGNEKIDLSNFWNGIDNKVFLKNFKERMIIMFSDKNNLANYFFLLMFLTFKSRIKEISNRSEKFNLNILYASEIYIFHMILSPHEESTRYPNNDKSKMGPEDYNEKSSIVSFSNNIFLELKEIIKHIDKMINTINKTNDRES